MYLSGQESMKDFLHKPMSTSKGLFVCCVNKHIWNNVAVFNKMHRIELHDFCDKPGVSLIFYKGHLSNILLSTLADQQPQLPSFKSKSEAQS